MRSQIVLIFTAVLAATIASANTFQCPELLGSCNTCIRGRNGNPATITRKVCEPYSEDECVRLYGRQSWICDDGCNLCGCHRDGIVQTHMYCAPAPYSYADCVRDRGAKPFEHGARIYECTQFGLASQPKIGRIIFPSP